MKLQVRALVDRGLLAARPLRVASFYGFDYGFDYGFYRAGTDSESAGELSSGLHPLGGRKRGRRFDEIPGPCRERGSQSSAR